MSKAEDLLAYIEEITKAKIQPCDFCCVDYLGYDELPMKDIAKAMYKDGWREIDSDSHQCIGLACP